MNNTLYTFFANPIVNIPPVLNSGICFSKCGINNLIIGYKTENTVKSEFLNHGSRIFRINLKSRNIPFAPLRKICSVIEFIFVCKKISQRSTNTYVVLFNEIASIIGKLIKNKKQIHWSLEFPENETKTLVEGTIKKIAYKSWNKAHTMVFPTSFRKAMGMVLNPDILQKNILTIHNSPLQNKVKTNHTSGTRSKNTEKALAFIQQQHSLLKKVVIYAGAVGNRYGWNSLIESIGNIQGNYSLLILGTKHQLGHSEFNDAIKKCAYPENVIWLDAIPYFEMQQVIKNADIGFVHYRGDTLNTYFSAPGKLYEYLKAGLCILTDSNACIAEDLNTHNSGIIFSGTLTANTLLQQLTCLKPEEIEEKKKNAKNLFVQKYTFEEQMIPLINLLKEYR